ncbi:hypothetical protein SLE2022_211720 [Rubroshorea leprosula]
MSPDRLFTDSKKNILIDEQALPNEIECLALETGNKILVEHLEPSCKVDYLTLLDKLPTLHEAQPTLTYLESLKAVGDNLVNLRHVHSVPLSLLTRGPR